MQLIRLQRGSKSCTSPTAQNYTGCQNMANFYTSDFFVIFPSLLYFPGNFNDPDNV